MPDPRLAANLIAELLRFLASHPKGYSSDDMMYIIRTWGKIATNIQKGGDPRRDGAAYWRVMQMGILRDNVTSSTVMHHASPDDDPSVKPSQAFRAALGDLVNSIFGNNPSLLSLNFNRAEGAFNIMLTGFRIKLAQADPSASQTFRLSLNRLSHQHAP